MIGARGFNLLKSNTITFFLGLWCERVSRPEQTAHQHWTGGKGSLQEHEAAGRAAARNSNCTGWRTYEVATISLHNIMPIYETRRGTGGTSGKEKGNQSIGHLS